MALFRQGGEVVDPASVATRHRADIQGLRAVAVLLVVFSHAGVSFLGGGYVGVDVFFVLSGFLITGLLLSEAVRTRSLSLPAFYARRAKRILPAAVLTLVATELAAYSLLNYVRAKQVIIDSVWASLFGANIRFAHVGTDYFARAQPPSPVQHYWSLSVEEQFYVVWPATLALVLFGLSRLNTRAHRSRVRERAITRLLTAISVIALVSLAWSILHTVDAPQSAYFSTLTRAWELGLGAALAVAGRHLEGVGGGVRSALGWFGLAAIGVAAVTFSSDTVFPGYAALLPTVGAAAVIAAGIGGSGTLAGRILSLPPMTFIGDRSYTLYLWHWPFLMLAAQRVGHDLGLARNLLLLAAAFALSVLTYQFFENPIRRGKWSREATMTLWPASAAAVVFVSAFALSGISKTESAAAERSAPPGDIAAPAAKPRRIATPAAGANALPAVVSSARAAIKHTPLPDALVPPVAGLVNDHYSYPPGCAASDGDTHSNVCRLADTAGKTVVIIGDSHAQMWMPALLPAAEERGWAVVPLDKSGCTPHEWATGDAECRSWFTWAMAQAKSLRPYMVIVTGSYSLASGQENTAAVSELASVAGRLKKIAQRVVIIGDPPGQPQQPVDCLLRPGATMGDCMNHLEGLALSQYYENMDALQTLPGIDYVDTTPWFCSDNICPVVVGRTIAYSDFGHVTATYAAELKDVFGVAIGGS